MGLNIGNIWQSQNQVSNNSNTVNSGSISSTENDTTREGVINLSDLTTGSSVSGKVLSAESDGRITILLSDQTTLSASVKEGVSLLPGQTVSFLVGSSKNNQILLNPLHTNLNTTPTIQNALSLAGLEMNETNVSMVTEMMRQGMNVGKDAVLSMNKIVSNNPNVDTSLAVKLTHLGVEVNESNAKQFVAYENLNHQLSAGVDQIAKDITDAFASLDGNDENAMKLFSGIVDLVNSEAPMTESALSELLAKANISNVSELFEVISNETELIPEEAKESETEEQTIVNNNQDKTVSSDSNTINNENGKELKQVLQLDDKALQTLMKEQNLSAKDVLSLIQKYLKDTFAKDNSNIDFSKIFKNQEFGKLVKDALSSNWLLKPEEFASKDKVEDFYQKLQSQTRELAELSKEVLGNNANLTNSTSSLSENVDFMNQLNQMFSYVQIPLKLSNQNANGDLFVYTNKKNLAAKDGTVSAYLHLTMDHLGDVDCYVTMKEQRVSTNFKVANDEILDLIEANIDSLNERLEKRGYHINCNVSVSTEETSIIGEMEKQLGVSNKPISMTSFDAKA